MQRLIGAGWLAPGGMRPDVFADMLTAYGPNECATNPIGWYLREAEKATAERQAAAHVNRRHRLARRHGHPTFYAYRVAWCQAHGHRSLWEYRKANGWQ